MTSRVDDLEARLTKLEGTVEIIANALKDTAAQAFQVETGTDRRLISVVPEDMGNFCVVKVVHDCVDGFNATSIMFKQADEQWFYQCPRCNMIVNLKEIEE